MDKSLQIAGVSILSAAAGLVVGYKVAEKRLTTQFELRLQQEEELMRTFFTTKPEVKKYPTPEAAVADLIPVPEQEKLVDPRETAQKVQYNKIVKKEEYIVDEEDEGAKAAAEEFVRKNVFDANKRNAEDPEVIEQDDFMGNVNGFEQSTLTFYADGQLADDRDMIIDDQLGTVGPGIGGRFGEGSSDENTVHIRNTRLRSHLRG